MTGTGKCPHCQAVLGSVRMESIPITAASHNRPVAGASFICPECEAILTVGAHPEYYLRSIIEAIATKIEPPGKE